jgi:hypothetical protein
MSILSSIETEYNTIINDGRSIADKLESLVGLHAKKQELSQLEPQLVSLIENAGIPTPEKVSQILAMVGKL